MTESTGDQPRAGQEAARLLSAAQGWLRSSAPHLAPVGEDGQTCPCPLCRAVAGVREADPESVGRWVDAAVAAATATLAQAGERLGEATAARPGDPTEGAADGERSEEAAPEGDPSQGGPSTDGGDPTDDSGAGQDGERGVRRILIVEETGEDA